MATQKNSTSKSKKVSDSKMIVNLNQIPDEIKDIDSWVLYDFDDKYPKTPLNIDGGPVSWKKDDETHTYDEAINALMKNDRFDGIGVAFSEDDDFYYIDFDNCFKESHDTASRKEWCPDIDRIAEETYSEYSTSGTGAHTFVKGEIPEWWEDADGEGEHEGVEIYDSRLCIFSGRSIGTNDVIHQDDFPINFEKLLLKTYSSIEGQEPPKLRDENSENTTHDEASDDVINALHDIKSDDIQDVLWSDYQGDGASGEWEEWDPEYRGSKSGTSLVRNKESGIWYDFKIGQKGFDTLKLFASERGRIDKPTEDLTGQEWVDAYKNLKNKVNIDMPELRSSAIDLDGDSGWDDIVYNYTDAGSQSERGRCHMASAKRLINDSGWLTTMDTDDLYHYSDGVYTDNGNQMLRKELTQNLNHQYTQRRASDIEERLRGQTLVEREDLGADEGLVVVDNGVLDVYNREIKEYDPDIKALNKMPVKYDEDAAEPTNFLNYLEDVVEDKKERMKLQEYVGYTLMHWNIKFEKALFVVGPTNSGKSTLIDIVNMLHDDDAVAHVTPQEILEQRFKSAQLFGSWLNTRNDIPQETMQNVGKFKELISGEEMVMEKKNQQNFTYAPDAKHIFAGNQLPTSSVDDSAMYERVLLCAMPKTIPREKQDRDLLKKIEDELPGVLNWALDGLDRLLDQNGFTADRTASETESMWNKWSSSVKRFKHECIDITGNENDIIAKGTAMKMFEMYAEKRGMPSASKKVVTETISASADVSHTPSGGTDGSGVYTGVTLTDLGQALLDFVDDDESDVDEEDIDELLSQY